MAKSSNRHAEVRPEYRELADMTYKQLKIACIVRGMEYNDVVEGDHNSLSHFFIKYYVAKADPGRLEGFDAWMDKQLEKRGYTQDDPVRAFRLSSIVDEDSGDLKLQKSKVKKAIKLEKVPKPKKERNDTFKVIKGTKKEYTMILTQKLHQLGKNMSSQKIKDRLVDSVMQKYPDANQKSIMIWYKRALNELNKA